MPANVARRGQQNNRGVISLLFLVLALVFGLSGSMLASMKPSQHEYYANCTDCADYAGNLGYPPSGTYAQPYNAGISLSGRAVSTAWRNAKRMIQQGYAFQPDGVFYWHGGCVTNPHGKSYDVYLPGAYPDHPEGRCSCPFFARHAICKHIYFAVHRFQIIQAVTASAASAKAETKIKAGRRMPAPRF